MLFFDVFRVFLRQSVKKIHLLLAIENHTEKPKISNPSKKNFCLDKTGGNSKHWVGTGNF